MKAEEIYNLFKEGISDLKGRFDSLEGRFESLETKIDDKFVTKESLAMQLKSMELRLSNYEEMRQDMRKMGWYIAVSVIGAVISILLYILQSGLLKGFKL